MSLHARMQEIKESGWEGEKLLRWPCDVWNSADHETAINSLRWTRYQTDVQRLRSFSPFHSAPLGISQRIAKEERGRLQEDGFRGMSQCQGYVALSQVRNCIVSQCIGSCETSAKRKGAPEKHGPPVAAAVWCMFHLKAKGSLPVACEQMSASQPDSVSPESGIDRANMFATLPRRRTREPPRPRMFHVNAKAAGGSSKWIEGEGGLRWEREGTRKTTS